MRTLDLFAGIGGFSLPGRWMGWQTAAFVEWDKFCQQVLDKNFNGEVGQSQRKALNGVNTTSRIPIFGDIDKFSYAVYKSWMRKNKPHEKDRSVDVVCGGFPCQPFSHAGKRGGTTDDRYLWPEMLRVIREVRPRWVVGENVAGLLSMDGGAVFEEVCASLEAEGYEVEAFVLPAISRGAPHRRDRVWIVAHRNGENDAGELERGGVKKPSSRSKGSDERQAERTPNGQRFWFESCQCDYDTADADRLNGDNGGYGSSQIPFKQEAEIFRGDIADPASPRPQKRGQSGIGELQEEKGEGLHDRPELNNSQSRLVGVPNKARLEGHGGYDERSRERVIGAADSEFGTITNPDSQQEHAPIEGGFQPEFGGADRGDQWREHWYEAATRLCGIFNGLSRELDPNRLNNGTSNQSITGQDLPCLWKNLQQEKIQRDVRGFNSILEPENLFAVLWKYFSQSYRQDDLPFESEEVQNAFVRNVWVGTKLGCPPQGWEYQEQYAREHSDSLSQLSHEITLVCLEEVKRYKKGRTNRLKALGNAIVPQVVYEIFRAIQIYEDENSL